MSKTPPNQIPELVNRYVHEVGRHLPRRQRADVQAELLSAVLDEVDARTGNDGTGTSATKVPEHGVVESVLREFGHPTTVANRYAAVPQYLIGPRLYPAFLFTLQVVGTVAGVLAIVGLVISLVAAPEWLTGFLQERGPVHLAGQLVQIALVNVGIVTVIFAALDRLPVVPPLSPDTGWDPRTCPRSSILTAVIPPISLPVSCLRYCWRAPSINFRGFWASPLCMTAPCAGCHCW